MAQLPAPTKNAAENVSTAAAILGALFDTKFAPFGTIASEFVKNKIQKQIREAQELIMEQLSRGDFSALSDEARDELIPIAFKMMRASLEGMSKAKLVLLSKMVRGAIGSPAGASIFDSVSERLRRLSDSDIEMISLIYQQHKSGRTIIHSVDGIQVPYIYGKLISDGVGKPYVDVLQALTNLNSVGFIVQKAELTIDMTELGYYLAQDFFSLCDLALANE